MYGVRIRLVEVVSGLPPARVMGGGLLQPPTSRTWIYRICISGLAILQTFVRLSEDGLDPSKQISDACDD